MYKSVLLVIGIIVAIAIFWPKNREGFDYNSCRAQGFSKEFCVTTPTGAMGAGTCVCADGRIGMQLPGFYGECVCQYPAPYII